MTAQIRYYEEVKAYRLAFSLQQRLYELSRRWPSSESHSLTSRVLRAARAVGAELSQAWAKRGDPAEFVAKLTEVDAELAETVHWMETARACGYIDALQYRELKQAATTLGSILSHLARGAQRLPAEEPRAPAPVQTLPQRLS